MDEADRRIPALLLTVTWIEVAVLIVAGGGLLIAHPTVVGIWPWPLAPFNLRFLGAIYVAALVAALLQSWLARWSPARLVTTMIFTFTLVVTALSFVHSTRFDFALPQVWVWFALYVGVCANAGLHLWRHRGLRLGAAPGPAARTLLTIQALLLGGYGLAMLALPRAAAAIWPWPLDVFHAQLYSVAFLTPAAGALVLRSASATPDWRTLGVTQLAWGALPIVALVVVDLQVRRVDWSSPGGWLWIALYGYIAAMGAWMLGASSRGAPVARAR